MNCRWLWGQDLDFVHFSWRRVWRAWEATREGRTGTIRTLCTFRGAGSAEAAIIGQSLEERRLAAIDLQVVQQQEIALCLTRG